MSKSTRPAVRTDASHSRSFLFDAAPPRLFSIDLGRPFLVDLAEGLINALGDDLSRAEIFFPTRRAVRAASEAVLDACEKRGVFAALLPRFRAVGDIEEDELIVFAGDAAAEIDLPPAVTTTERMAVLARLVAARDRAFSGNENWPAAIAAARELAKLLDSFYTDEIDPAALKSLDVADAARHWATSLEFLEIVTTAWPAHLNQIGRIDPSQRRAALINAAARRFADHPPAHPVIIAGTTASAPAVARLVNAIARAPVGAAVLPGLDRTIDKRAWMAIDDEDAHPQSGLKRLLGAMGIAPGDVRPWPNSGGANPRANLLTLTLRPAAATDDWLSLVNEMTGRDLALVDATRGMALIEAENEEAEASVIAAIFRRTIETPAKTAILVTPDRQLSRRVALKMRRWGVRVDDSAGVPFANSVCGTFLRLAAAFLDDPGDPVAILALVRHPLTRAGLSAAERAKAADVLDRALRGARPAKGLSSVEGRLCENPAPNRTALALIAALSEAAALFPNAAGASFAELFDGHIAAAERLAGASQLWSGDDGDAGSILLSELRGVADDISAISGRRYAEVFSALIAGAAVRSHSNAHPRLAILGPLEARMQSADCIILGGLNDGVWPADAAGDPFLSRGMRKKLRLPSPEQRIGLSAHDFSSLVAHKNVILTRARRAGGKPAKPSRWIVRLKNILTGAGALASVDRSSKWRGVIDALDRPDRVCPIDRPRPKAGPGRRPREVSVTRIEKWLRDPYSIYALYLLRLKKFEDPGAPFGAREMGSLLHKVFECAALEAAAPTLGSLRALYDALAPEYGIGAADRRFWSAAADDSFAWFAEFDAERRREGRIALAESGGAMTFPELDPAFTLTAKADRIDILNNGDAAIHDYKLRRVPSEKQIKYFSPQLPLTGAIVEAGGFDVVGKRRVASYAYCRLINRKDKDNENTLFRSGEEAQAAIAEAAEGLKAWVRRYDDPQTVYLSQPRPQFMDEYGDYDQLARRREWGSSEDDGEGGAE